MQEDLNFKASLGYIARSYLMRKEVGESRGRKSLSFRH
jgi:hypothetical protein